MTINVATAWRTNAEMIIDAFTILRAAGLYDDLGPVFDPTYGDGKWWTMWQPPTFVAISRRTFPAWDYTSMTRIADKSMMVTAFDPPYSAKGGRETSTIKTMDRAYGLDDSPPNPAGLLTMNLAGLGECCRVTTHAVLMKSMDFVTGGELHCHTRRLEEYAESLGWVVYERLVHLPSGGRPQPSVNRDGTARRELRARQRPSTLSILVPVKMRRGLR